MGDPISDGTNAAVPQHLDRSGVGLARGNPPGIHSKLQQFFEQFRTRFDTSKTTSRMIHELWQIR
ncbi:hypothetical protein AXF42_Ash021313 [Apostasia shenzhenica]|uniref:Uncharacterized protein n=1 Tax=Apostasia shenzhenica TaxID=1088818 RepID=A0A2H9ZY38_9ASPA|nr:hypothetical protein AXF42_Ash021313 [Apostasia shenzhenica]